MGSGIRRYDFDFKPSSNFERPFIPSLAVLLKLGPLPLSYFVYSIPLPLTGPVRLIFACNRLSRSSAPDIEKSLLGYPLSSDFLLLSFSVPLTVGLSLSALPMGFPVFYNWTFFFVSLSLF